MKENLEEKGILPKYIIQKSNGEPVSPNAEYFVLRLDDNSIEFNPLISYNVCNDCGYIKLS